jgi:uncharacterized protein (DUF924 family)
MTTVEEILKYWFGDSSAGQQVLAQKGSLWFGKSEQVDREIESRFGVLVEAAAQQGLLVGPDPIAHRYLATILLLDQFTRNIYRGHKRCFACDELALQLTLKLLQAGHEQQLRPIERVFVYLPLEHSEKLEIQNRSVKLFQELADGANESSRSAFEGFLDYAVRHQEIIARFGRFPHRNQILGRKSTDEELAFLQLPNSSF